MGNDVRSAIIFAIGTTGHAATVAKFAAVGTAVAGVGVAINKLVQDSEEYTRLLSRTTIDMSRYNAATKGLINTADGLRGATKLQAAEIEVSARQMASLGKAAIFMNQQLGGEAGGATEQFNLLVDAVVKGSAEAFIPFGFQLENTADKSKAAAEALDKLSGKYHDATLEVETAHEAWYGFTNTLSNIIDQNVEYLLQTDLVASALENATSKMDGMSALYESTGGRVTELTHGIDGLRHAFEWFHLTLFGTREEMEKYLVSQVKAVKIMQLQHQIDVETQKGEQKKAREERLALEKAALEANKKKPTGGARRVVGTYEMDISEAEITEAMLEEAIGGPVMDVTVDVLADIRNVLLPEFKSDLITDGLFPSRDIYEVELEYLEDAEARKLEIRELSYEEQYNLQLSAAERSLGIEQDAVNASHQLWRSGTQGRLEQMQGFFGNLALLQYTESRKLFQIGKVAAVAEAGIQGALGAVKAYQAMSGIPYVGPVLGAIAAAAVLTYTGVQIAQIKAQKFEGGSGGAGSVAPPQLHGGSSSFGEGAFGQGDQGGKTIENTIILDGQVLHQSIMDINDSASQQGRRSLATAA